MKAWLVRFVSLSVFNVVVLLLMGLLPGVRVGWAALWAAVLLTALTLWIKPAIATWFSAMAAKSAHQRTKTGEKLVRFGIVFVVELLVWVLVVWFSGVHVSGLLWGWVLPPIALLIAWIVYDAIDERIELRAGALYDRATGVTAVASDATASDAAVQQELKDGLTPEQRRMLDELG